MRNNGSQPFLQKNMDIILTNGTIRLFQLLVLRMHANIIFNLKLTKYMCILEANITALYATLVQLTVWRIFVRVWRD